MTGQGLEIIEPRQGNGVECPVKNKQRDGRFLLTRPDKQAKTRSLHILPKRDLPPAKLLAECGVELKDKELK